ncbi:MAG: hypothetical protein KDA41_09975, partial [Planctomycetales bacterium]|nr:hypothetical protein [Planctomycetales bacterium]
DRTYFVRIINESELSLHATPSDAADGADPIRFTTSGRGEQQLYRAAAGQTVAWWGQRLNFMHSVFLAALAATLAHVVVSLLTAQPSEEQSRLTWTQLGGHRPDALRKALWKLLASLGLFTLLAVLMARSANPSAPLLAGLVAGAWTWLMFLDAAIVAVVRSQVSSLNSADDREGASAGSLLEEDRFWGGLLCAVAVFMLFYFR